MRFVGAVFALAILLLFPTSAAAAECQFVLGFKTLRDLIGHDVVGECLENEHYNHIGDSVQQTTGGLLVWRKADNWTAFTDGYRTWINGPTGLVQRLNTERFAWEADYAPGTATPTPTERPTPSSIPTPSPRDALVELYEATDGLNWENSTNWLSDRPIGTWHGVTTDSNGWVTGLWLNNNQLSGSIPPELGSLVNLTGLYLYNNQLSGGIPPELSSLANLTRLHLSGNQLRGGIPPELGSLANLTELYLGGNQLSGEIPPEFGSLANLTGLHLDNNQLSGEIPPEFGSLANLTRLHLDNNQLSGSIPPELGSLANLTRLHLYNNQLSGGIPPELGSLANLTELYLSGNQLSGSIPPELGSLVNLTGLYLYNNQLSGSIPPELGSLANLTRLHLSGNLLSGGIPPELGNLANLTRLHLGGNQHLTACIPEALRGLRATLPHDASSLNGMADCTGMEVVQTVSQDTSIYNENVFVLPVTEDITAATLYDTLPLWDYAERFYELFHDDFDFLIFVSNLYSFNRTSTWRVEYSAYYQGVSNDVRGIGKRLFSDSRAWGSEGALQGAIFIGYADRLFISGPHELMHRWGNTIVPTVHGAHWGFSSANGEIGGFDIADLVDHGGGRYSAGEFGTGGRGGPERFYSPIELYIAGLIPPEEVPDLWVAEDGEWLDERTDDGDRLFTASRVRTYTIEDIIDEHGKRVPDHRTSQKEFRAAVVLLIDENHPLYKWQLDRLSGAIDSFSHPGANSFYAYRFDTYNFWEATGGRATITMDGLSRSLK